MIVTATELKGFESPVLTPAKILLLFFLFLLITNTSPYTQAGTVSHFHTANLLYK